MEKKFIPVCAIDDVAEGQMKKISTPQGDILLANVDGSFHAVADLCTHEEVSLYLGCLRGKTIECSLHSGTFDITTGKALSDPVEKDLETFQTRVDKGEVFLEMTVE